LIYHCKLLLLLLLLRTGSLPGLSTLGASLFAQN